MDRWTREYLEAVTDTGFWLIVLLFLTAIALAGIFTTLDPPPVPPLPHSHAQVTPAHQPATH